MCHEEENIKPPPTFKNMNEAIDFTQITIQHSINERPIPRNVR